MATEVKSHDQYGTTETSLAAYLYTEGYRIIDIDYTSDSPRAKFIFENGNTTKLYELERLYLTGKALVDPSTYSRIARRLSTIARRRLPWTEGVMNA